MKWANHSLVIIVCSSRPATGNLRRELCKLAMPCAAVSVITDECNPEHLAPFNIDEVIAIAKESEPLLTRLFSEFMSRLKV